MPAKIPLLDHMLIRFKGTLFLIYFFSHTCDWCFIILCFVNTKMSLCPVALIMFAHSSATVWTLLECRGDDVILFYFQQEVKLQSRPTGSARGTRTSLARMGYVHIHAVLSHTFLLDCLRLVMRAAHRGVTYTYGGTVEAQVQHLTEQCATFHARNVCSFCVV